MHNHREKKVNGGEMFEHDLHQYRSYFSTYGELRLHKNSSEKQRLMNGDVMLNTRNVEQGFSVRTGSGGIWGFSSSAKINKKSIKQCMTNASDRYKWLKSRKQGKHPQITAKLWQGEYLKHSQKESLTSKEKIDFMKQLDAYIAAKYKDLSTRNIFLMSFDVEKKYLNSAGGSFHVNRPFCYLAFNLGTSKNGEPVSLHEVISGSGYAEDVLLSPESYYKQIDEVYEHLRKKTEAVYARSGMHDVVLDASLSGILSHEAIGHTTEADMVLSGSVAKDLLGKPVASELITLVDVAHSYEGKECLVPVYVDDEGTKASDVVLIEKGILKNFMHDRLSALKTGMTPQGNARAYAYYDEPLIRMRNTMILPGESKLEDMIADVEDGYYLMKSGNGQADSTSEFMFGVTLGYEIKKGKLGKAIKDTTISGIAYDVLKSVTAVSKDYKMELGFCGKKQSIAVSDGGPAIRCRMNIGGK